MLAAKYFQNLADFIEVIKISVLYSTNPEHKNYLCDFIQEVCIKEKKKTMLT